MNKKIGYVIAVIGLIIVALSFPAARTPLNITNTFGLNDIVIMIIGIALAILGFFLARGSRTRTAAPEVPIYHGGQIVGYRRH